MTWLTTSLITSIDSLFFLVYRFIVIPLTLFILRNIRRLIPRDSKLRKMIEVRQSPQRPALVARPIWIHAASGEIEYAKPVIRSLRENYPQIPLLITYFSPSAEKLLRSIEGIDVALPLPWDERNAIARFIEYSKPLAVMFSRTDVWPELAYQLKNQKIPSLLFSATLANNSSRIRGPGRFLNRFAFNCLQQIFCVNAEDQREFRRLGVQTPIEILGDSRFDQAIYRLQNPKVLKNIFNFSNALKTKTLIAGSTWPEDEKILTEGLFDFIQGGGRIIWAPHEVKEEHLTDLERIFKINKWQSCRYSRAEMWSTEISILLIDEVGILPELYNHADIAFVGGSFKDRVHSVMEPLAAGLPVLVGPYHENNREALHFSLKDLPGHANYHMVQPVSSSAAIRLALQDIRPDPEVRLKIQSCLQEESGATAEIISRLHWNV